MLEQYYRINQAAGLSLHIRQDGTLAISALSITARGSQLDIDKKLPELASLAALKKDFPAGTPVAVNLSGKGVLYKQIDKAETINQASFHKVLPNGKPEDFYIQNFISGDQSFVAIIRKTEADKWIGQIKEQGLVPMGLSLGPYPVNHIIPQLNVYEKELIFNGNRIKRDEQGNWTGYRGEETALTPFPLKIGPESISEKLLIPYAAAFQLVLEAKLEPTTAAVDYLEDALQKKTGDNKIRVHGVLVLSILFTLLLINFIAFSVLTSSDDKLASQLGRFTQSSSNIQDINEQLKKKEGLLQTLGWDNGVNKSALIDQIASLVPGGISWQQVAINPVDLNNSRVQKTIVFFKNRIRVTGTSEKIIPVNEWIARIKTRAWVKNVQLDSYAFNSELNTGQFTILLDY